MDLIYSLSDYRLLLRLITKAPPNPETAGITLCLLRFLSHMRSLTPSLKPALETTDIILEEDH